MDSESRPMEVHPTRLMNAADAIIRNRDAGAGDSPVEQARSKGDLEQYTNTELMEAAEFLRRAGLGPMPRKKA